MSGTRVGSKPNDWSIAARWRRIVSWAVGSALAITSGAAVAQSDRSPAAAAQPAAGGNPAAAAASATTASTAATRTLALKPSSRPDASNESSITFIGNATVLIRYAGITILTDPNFLHKGEHVHLGYGLKSERLTNPAIELDALPPIDLVLLSHLHGDHFDQIVEKRLDRNVPIVTTAHGARGLQKMGFTATQALATWETLAVSKGDATLRITSMPGRHGPAVLNRALPPVMGSLLEFGGAGQAARYRMYISGDTLVHDDIREIPKRYPGIDLALLHLGGTRILNLLLVTMDAEQGVEMLRIIDPGTGIPIHYNDYTVFKSPIEDFQRAVRDAGLERRVRYLKHGDKFELGLRPAR